MTIDNNCYYTCQCVYLNNDFIPCQICFNWMKTTEEEPKLKVKRWMKTTEEEPKLKVKQCVKTTNNNI